MIAKAWLPLIYGAIICLGNEEVRELQTSEMTESRKKMALFKDIAGRVGDSWMQELFSNCGQCCSEDYLLARLQTMLPSMPGMPGNESEYFCREDVLTQATCNFCREDLNIFPFPYEVCNSILKRKPTWNSSGWHYLFAFIAHSVGHTWWSPCSFKTLVDPDLDRNGCLTRKEVGGMLIRVYGRFWGWTFTYHRQIDKDSDGCATAAEITNALNLWSPRCAFNLVHELRCLTETKKCNCSAGVSVFELAEHLVMSSFDTVDRLALAASQRAAKMINSTIELNERLRNASSNITVEQQKEESESAVVVASISGSIALVALVACAATCWYQHKQRKALRQPQKLLRAKIDAWSTFDDNLTAKTSTLHPSFVHCLGLGGFLPDQLGLLEITHVEDVEVLNSLLHQMKSSKNLNSLPLMAQVRFEYGVTQFKGHSASKLYVPQSENFVHVEILMAWSSSTSVIVGLTSLSAACPPSAPSISSADLAGVMLHVQEQKDENDALSCQASADGPREYILNAPSQVTGSASDAGSFKSMEAESHRGGQITKECNDSKNALFKRRISQGLAGLAAKDSHIDEASSVHAAGKQDHGSVGATRSGSPPSDQNSTTNPAADKQDAHGSVGTTRSGSPLSDQT